MNGAGSDDPFGLDRFVVAKATAYDTALAELRAGRKLSHWMWFVFPQLAGLGASPTARHFAIWSLEEARAYLAHPVLGPRLRACADAALSSPAPSLAALFGSPDDLKFCSAMTLFEVAAEETGSVFERALKRWCAGRRDRRTLALLGPEAGGPAATGGA